MDTTVAHSNMVRTLAKSGEEIKLGMTVAKFRDLVNACRIVALAAKLLDKAKRAAIYGKEDVDFEFEKSKFFAAASSASTEHTPFHIMFAALTPLQYHQLHMALGVAGEGGELIEAFAKAICHDELLDHENLEEELGDIEFYLEGVRQAFEMSREKTLQHNLTKLKKRYGEALAYSDQAALHRADKK